jgi:hypothetical protein
VELALEEGGVGEGFERRVGQGQAQRGEVGIGGVGGEAQDLDRVQLPGEPIAGIKLRQQRQGLFAEAMLYGHVLVVPSGAREVPAPLVCSLAHIVPPR